MLNIFFLAFKFEGKKIESKVMQNGTLPTILGARCNMNSC